MLLRIENSFLQLANKLGKPFSEEDKEKLARSLELNYDKIRSLISVQENAKDQAKPAIIELGNIGWRFFALNIYYSRDEMGDDIPMSIRELLPSQSPVHIDVMAAISQSPDDSQGNYLKVAQVYDDGDIHSHYMKEVRQEDQGIRHIENISKDGKIV
jgi:hypothetical protein